MTQIRVFEGNSAASLNKELDEFCSKNPHVLVKGISHSSFYHPDRSPNKYYSVAVWFVVDLERERSEDE